MGIINETIHNAIYGVRQLEFGKGGIRMKKVYLVIAVVALTTCLTGFPYLIEGIAARGWDGVNYGRIFFPLLISGIAFGLFKRKK